MILSFVFCAVAAAFLFMSLGAMFHQYWARRLPSLQSLATGAGDSRVNMTKVVCSVVIAARDEQARIEQTVRHLLAQRGVQLEVIVIDDRSADQTGEILKKIGGEDRRVRVSRVDTL